MYKNELEKAICLGDISRISLSKIKENENIACAKYRIIT